MSQKERFYADIMAMNSGVTGSLNLVIAKLPNGKTIRFVVDCGLFQEEKYEAQNQILAFNAENIDFVLVTHNHVDHTGRLPFIVRKGFNNKIFATETTCKLLPLALHDSYNVLQEVYKRKHQKLLYNETDVDHTISLIEPCKYNETIQINENIKVTFLNNGHLIGAAVILVQIIYPGYENINLLFTGDYNSKNIFFDVNPIPNWILKLPLTVIQESTYGDMETTEMTKCFKENILKYIKNKGTIIVPVFSLGRSQEILYELQTMQNEGMLDIDVPIYLDGKLAIKYTNFYLKDGLDIKPEMKNFLPQNLTFVDKTNRNNILKDDGTKIILTTSGMGSYGPAQVYIPEYITHKNALIHFTGFTAEGTLGDRLKKCKLGGTVEVAGLFAKKNAEVEYTTEYSAHAKANEMLAFLNQFTNLKLVLVNHGEEDVKNIFAQRIVNEVNPKNVGVLGKEYFFRVCPYGLVKTLSTKFK